MTVAHDDHTCHLTLWTSHSPLFTGQSQDSGLGGSTQDVIVFGTTATEHPVTTPTGQLLPTACVNAPSINTTNIGAV